MVYYVTYSQLVYREILLYSFKFYLIFIFLLLRLVKAIEHLQHFSLSADPSFRHYQMDVSRELKALSSMDFIQGFHKNSIFKIRKFSRLFIAKHFNAHGFEFTSNLTPHFPSSAPLAPVIDTQKTLAYNELYLCWRLPQDSAPAWHYSVEYQRKVGGAGALWGRVWSEGSSGSNGSHSSWQRLDDVGGTSAVIDKLEMDSVYVLRVRGCNKAGFGEYSEEVYLHTPPAPGTPHKYTNTLAFEPLQNISFSETRLFPSSSPVSHILNPLFLFCIFSSHSTLTCILNSLFLILPVFVYSFIHLSIL